MYSQVYTTETQPDLSFKQHWEDTHTTTIHTFSVEIISMGVPDGLCYSDSALWSPEHGTQKRRSNQLNLAGPRDVLCVISVVEVGVFAAKITLSHEHVPHKDSLVHGQSSVAKDLHQRLDFNRCKLEEVQSY